MAEIEIDVKAEIFDDPEFCSEIDHFENGPKCCKFLWWPTNTCKLFDSGLLLAGMSTYFKCPQCKEAWKKAKDEKTVGFKTDSFPHVDGGAPETITLTINGESHKYVKEKESQTVGKQIQKRECYICGKEIKHSIGYCADHYQEFEKKVNDSAHRKFTDRQCDCEPFQSCEKCGKE